MKKLNQGISNNALFSAAPKLLSISGLKDEAYFEGDMINITCEAQGGNPLAELTWYKGTEKVS